MLHTVHLSPLTEKRLTDIVILQMCLLRYALFTKEVEEASCAAYLNRHKRFQGRGAQIAHWLFDQRAPKRHEPLERFGRCDGEQAAAFRQEKRSWCRKLHCQVLALSWGKVIPLEKLYNQKSAPSWQHEAAEFLIHFYTDLCGEANFAGYFFSEPGATKFGRQEFLKEFREANGDLYVCAFCDEAGYYTIVEQSIRSDIDHYFPKSIYPHFSCHPYNLIPTCKVCNQEVKQRKDPLDGSNGMRLSLSEIFLPYRSPGLDVATYLGIRLEQKQPGEPVAWVHIEKLRPREQTDQQILYFIDTLSRVYDIPHRWSDHIDKIGETLFRRMRQFLSSGREAPFGFDMAAAMYNTLNQLLFYLHEEDQRRDPFAFVMTWILVALLNEEYRLLAQEVEPKMTTKSSFRYPLIRELVKGLGQDIDHNEKRERLAQSLLAVVRGEMRLEG
jgi:hypothetical protein